MTRYAKRELKYSVNENFNFLSYVEWDRFVTLTGEKIKIFVYEISVTIPISAFTIDLVFENYSLSAMAPYVYSRVGRNLSIYGSECQIMGPIRNPNWSTSGTRVTLSYLSLSMI
jgi:hypothetical protein